MYADMSVENELMSMLFGDTDGEDSPGGDEFDDDIEDEDDEFEDEDADPEYDDEEEE